VAGCIAEANFSKRDFGELFFEDYSANPTETASLYVGNSVFGSYFLLFATWRP
jgi:hypothetical protein